MSKVPLLNQINKKMNDKSPASPLAEGIEYQQYEVVVEGKPLTVNIPLRESANFENKIVEYDNNLSRTDIRKLLREFRGIRG